LRISVGGLDKSRTSKSASPVDARVGKALGGSWSASDLPSPASLKHP